MKYILSILLALLIAQPAYALKQVSGEVPEIPPVMTPPPNLEPNVRNNVQLSNPDFLNQVSKPEATVTESRQAQETASQPAYTKSSPWLWWVSIIVVLGAVVFWLKKKNDSL